MLGAFVPGTSLQSEPDCRHHHETGHDQRGSPAIGRAVPNWVSRTCCPTTTIRLDQGRPVHARDEQLPRNP